MSYISDTLETDERVEYEARLSWWSLWIRISIGLYFTLTTLLGTILQGSPGAFWLYLPYGGVGAFLLGSAYLTRKTTELVITNKRLVSKTGWISTKTNEIQLKNVEGVEVRQSVIGKFANYGTIYASGRGSSRAPIRGIRDPFEFRRQLSNIQRKTAAQNIK